MLAVIGLRLTAVRPQSASWGRGWTDILVHQTCFSDATITKDDNLDFQKDIGQQKYPHLKHLVSVTRSRCGDCTLRRTFFLDAMVGNRPSDRV